jgi:hypothetical protein
VAQPHSFQTLPSHNDKQLTSWLDVQQLQDKQCSYTLVKAAYTRSNAEADYSAV